MSTENLHPDPAGLRRATPRDAAALSDIGAATFVETFGHLYPPEDLNAFLAKTYSLEASQALLADRAVGVWFRVGCECTACSLRRSWALQAAGPGPGAHCRRNSPAVRTGRIPESAPGCPATRDSVGVALRAAPHAALCRCLVREFRRPALLCALWLREGRGILLSCRQHT